MWIRKAGWIFLIAVAAEIAGIMAMGSWIGGWPTFGLLLIGAALGGLLVQTEGRKSWNEARSLMQEGRPPGPAVLNGLCVVAGGILLVVPGFLSDIVGLTLLLPFTRPLYKGYLYLWLERRFRSGSIRVFRGPHGPS
ncbi:FxsA family protein [Cohnella fermenti]|uniref:FxsA family protein n=1 Tax=Cohnella fermenti TaxID=2565925 RepID=A0A4S4BG01_9BACL|nr:FxsA family protein [Cohnella fermenti]THF73317.1 FxsA family protein [Cohnella fermenti]